MKFIIKKMATALIGNLLVSSIRTVISASTATGQNNGSGGQNLLNPISATTTLGSGNYAYQWSQSGTSITFSASTSSSTNVTYASLSVAGSTTIFCTVRDTWTGVQVVTSNCVITWPVQSTPITSVTWSIAGATNSTYTGSAQSVTVVSVVPSGATYSTSTTTATNAGGVASTTITGTGSYSGSFTSPNLTISKANLSVSGFAVEACGGFSVARMTFTVSGFVGGQSGSLTTWIGTSSPTSVAPVSTNDNFADNAVSQTTNANPISVTNGTPFAALYLCVNVNGFQYWVQVSGGSNYNTSGFNGPVDQQCGS